jgi:hypothetical protein
MLSNKIAKNQQRRSFDQGQFAQPGEDFGIMDPDVERDLQAHGFDFTDPIGIGQSPETESISSDRGGRSPLDILAQPPPIAQMDTSTSALLDTFSNSPQGFSGRQTGFSPNADARAGQIFASNAEPSTTDMDFDFANFAGNQQAPFDAFQNTDWSNLDLSSPRSFAGSWPQPNQR